jgi:PqqD family protein of HPr-rel-A system
MTHPLGSSGWRVAEGQALRWRCWSGNYAVFNPLSGQTHFLDIVSGKILSLLMAGAHDVDEIGSGVSEFLEVPNDDRLASTIAGILMRLEDVGLVERSN